MATACPGYETAVPLRGTEDPSISRRSGPKNPWADGDTAAGQSARRPGMIDGQMNRQKDAGMGHGLTVHLFGS